MAKIEHIPFNDIFELERGNIISNKYINSNSGEYPVYSTQLDEEFGFINTYMYDGKYLLWNTDGLAGYIRLVDGKFSFTNIVGIMLVKEPYKDKNISLEYVKEYLEPIFRLNTKGRMGENGKNEYTKLNIAMIKRLNIKIPIPLNDEGNYDLEMQNEIANKFRKINEQKKLLERKKEEIEDFEIEDFTGYEFKETNLVQSSLCSFAKKNLGMPMKGLKPYEDESGIPVYTASRDWVIKVRRIPGKDPIKATKQNPILSYAKDGDGTAGTNIIIHTSDFYIGSHREALIINKDNLDINYLYWRLVDMKHKYDFNQSHPATQNNMKKVVICIPLNSNKEYDIDAQKEIAKRYEKINDSKDKILQQLNMLLVQEIQF